jgi:hypothetical protein
MNRNLLIGITAFGVVSAATTASALAAAAHAHPRTTTALQASLNYCSHQTGGQSRTQAAASWFPFQIEVGSGSVSSEPTPSAPAYSTQDMLNDMQRTNDANAAATEQNNAASAAATQTEVLFNTVYFPANN